MPNPFDNEELYNRLNVAGILSPGQCTLSGHERVENWDVKEADGSAGAATTSKGKKLAQFTASFYLVRDDAAGIDEFDEWERFAEFLLLSLSSKTPTALDIYHPDLAQLRISSVVVASIGGLTHDGKGGATAVVKFIEYAPPKKAGGSPKGSKSGSGEGKSLFDNTGAPKKPDPNKDVKDELDEVLTQAQAEGASKPKAHESGLLDP